MVEAAYTSSLLNWPIVDDHEVYNRIAVTTPYPQWYQKGSLEIHFVTLHEGQGLTKDFNAIRLPRQSGEDIQLSLGNLEMTFPGCSGNAEIAFPDCLGNVEISPNCLGNLGCPDCPDSQFASNIFTVCQTSWQVVQGIRLLCSTKLIKMENTS